MCIRDRPDEDIFSNNMGRTSVQGQLRIRQRNTKATVPLDVPNDAPRDFGPEVAFGVKFQILFARQEGREMSAPKPYVTDPFRPLSSTTN